MQNPDRLQLGAGRGQGGVGPVSGVLLQRPLPEGDRRDAAALQLEREVDAVADQVGHLVRPQGREGVGVEIPGLATAQAGGQALREQLLVELVQDPDLARHPDQVGVLAQQSGADPVEGADPGRVQGGGFSAAAACGELFGHPLPQLGGRRLGEGDGQDLSGRDALGLHQPAEALHHGEGLARARPGGDQVGAGGTGMGRSGLLCGRSRGPLHHDHSTGAPTRGQMVAWGQPK